MAVANIASVVIKRHAFELTVNCLRELDSKLHLPFRPKFEELPDIDPEEFVQYFNLEFGITQNNPDDPAFTSFDFSYIGLHVIDGIETMCWSVKQLEVCATVQPYEDTYLIAMGAVPGDNHDS